MKWPRKRRRNGRGTVRELRTRYRDAGVFVVSLVSSPGSGKTSFLEKTLTLLRPTHRIGALVGDLATENDATRLARSQSPVKQIVTGTLCHLEAAMIRNAVDEFQYLGCGIITKMDLAAAVEIDLAALQSNIERVRPGMRVFKVATKTGAGFPEWLKLGRSARKARL